MRLDDTSPDRIHRAAQLAVVRSGKEHSLPARLCQSVRELYVVQQGGDRNVRAKFFSIRRLNLQLVWN